MQMLDHPPTGSEIQPDSSENPPAEPQKPPVPRRVRILRYVKNVVYIELALCALAALSFLFTRGFTLITYSERLFYIGLSITLVGGFVAVAVMFIGADTRIRKLDPATHAWDVILERRRLAEKRYDASVQVWLIGALCIVISAIVQVLSARLGL